MYIYTNLSVRVVIFRQGETQKENFLLYCWQLEGLHCCGNLIGKSVLLWHKKQTKPNFTVQHESHKEFPDFQVLFIRNI